jgi:hypothetical protein
MKVEVPRPYAEFLGKIVECHVNERQCGNNSNFFALSAASLSQLILLSLK